MIVVGFTGTQRGMTDDQSVSVDKLLRVLKGEEFHHGGCIGADVQAAWLARRADYKTIRHPGNIPSKQDEEFKDDVVLEMAENLHRNRKIVEVSDVLIAAPGEDREMLRSGTWSTIRRARKVGYPTYVVYPDGMIR